MPATVAACRPRGARRPCFARTRPLGSARPAERFREPVANWDTRVFWAPDFSSGFFLAASDGHVFAAGNAPSLGGVSVSGSKAIAGLALTPDAFGYWFAGADGRTYAFGDAQDFAVPSGVSGHLPIAAIAGA